MAGIWKTTTQKISWFCQQRQLGTLDLNAKYQRDIVWPESYKIFLIDTIINNLSVPKIYLETKTDDNGNTMYIVADGKQRLTAIFEFIDGDFTLSRKHAPTITEDLEDRKFIELPIDIKKRIWDYELTVDNLNNYTENEMRDMFIRLNKNNAKLNKQELRHARYYDSDFLKIAEEASENDYWLNKKIVSRRDMHSMKDVEFISELLTLIMKGITNKKDELDDFYAKHEEMDNKAEVLKNFNKVFELIQEIIPDIESTRFNNKGDFYSLFYTINKFLKQGFKFNQKINKGTRSILIEINNGATDESENPDLRQYFTLTVNSSDSFTAREYRANYLSALIEPLLVKTDKKRAYSEWEKKFIWHRTKNKKCAICKKIVKDYRNYEPDHDLPWSKGGPTILSNGQITHGTCNSSKKDKVK